MYTASWDQHEKRLASLDEVEALLEGLHAQFSRGDPMLVTIELAGTGDSLSIGLGTERSVLSYVRGDKAPPYYTSTGGSDVDEAISFRFGGEWSEFPPSNAVPTSVAREAIRQFCETGKLPDNVQWEEV